ncbi:dihydrolipoyl dehydrogenase family protein [Aporhodopirellula aestuarii]|uniref:NAD(P)/FAD-dependent oxidoreductase n=1 Tax=Aporhodopirellula aestuarii TaxID=2950107 RepID=A0ABT0TYL3_9BACT|nr:NAD(P)/FAD-dependent oxidoreductase [Aporhodopirellula aestuarii]MCM2369679.1 NAD(P)/FAD-dependent oxidoreductase [Aporhodopirellula aestuarii]
MKEQHFDLIVLGSGPAGSTVATKAVEDGKSVAIVESREYGGTCALRGCNPKKVYANAGTLIDQVRRAEGKLVVGSESIRIDWENLLRFKQEFTQPVKEERESSFQSDGIATFHGNATFTGPNRLSTGSELLSASRIVIATGATPTKIDVPGSQHIRTSDEFLELAKLPKHVVFIGGGYISMEFAHVVARCGSDVTIVERDGSVLSGFDPDLVEQLTQYSRRRGIQFRFDATMTAIESDAGGSYRVQFEEGEPIECGLIVHGAGRVPNINSLDLQTGGIAFDKDGITVDKTLRSTTNEHVFAAGDCAASGVPRLTPTANEEARILVKNLFSDQPESIPDYGPIPKVAFTTPAIAAVGLSEKDAAKSFDIEVRTEDSSSWGSVRKTGDVVAGYKILVDKQTDQVVGAHLLGPGAEETINLFALAMKFELSATDIKSTLFAFPTYSSDVRRML